MKIKLIIIFFFACQIVNTFCSRQVLQGPSYQVEKENIDDLAESDKALPIKAENIKVDKLKVKPEIEIKNQKDLIMPVNRNGISDYNSFADEIISTAEKYLGIPHCKGRTSKKCLDCSGLLVTVFATQGIYLPHNSEEQSRYGKIISKRDELKKGDLVFFIRSYKTNRFITHSGIYIGNNKFIHASSKKGVTITSLNDSWWTEKFIFGTRVFE